MTNLQPHEQSAKGDVGRQPPRSFNSQIIALDSTEIETMKVIKYPTLLYFPKYTAKFNISKLVIPYACVKSLTAAK
jgi:hypothetical protein